MDFMEAISLLDPSTIKVVKLRKKHYDCISALHLTDPFSSASIIAPEAICFGKASQFNAIPDKVLSAGSFILMLDEPLKPLPVDIAVVTCNTSRDLRACYERLTADFQTLRQIKEGIFALTFLASKGSGLAALADKISDMFNAPINVLDTSLAIVAHSEYFPSWIAGNKEKENGFLPEQAQATLKEQGLINSIKTRETTVFSWSDLEGHIYYNHFTPISIGNTIIGSFSVLTQDAPMRASRIALLPTISNILSTEMQKTSSHLLNKSMYYSHLFSELLSGQMTEPPDAISYRFSVFGYSLKKYKRILYVDMSSDYFDSSQTQALAERLHRILENNVYVVRDRRDIILLGSMDKRPDEGVRKEPASKRSRFQKDGKTQKQINQSNKDKLRGSDLKKDETLLDNSIHALIEIAREVGVRIGISSVFENILHAPSHLKQAQRAIITGQHYNPNGAVFFFPRYRMADLLNHIDDPTTLFSFRYPPLMELISEDLKRGTNLAYTLLIYLQDPAHPNDICRKLFIHKNTLYYRLERIREIMEVDIKDGWVIAQIEMTFLILKHQGKFDELVTPNEDHKRDLKKQSLDKTSKQKPSNKTKKGPDVRKIVEYDASQENSTTRKGA